MKNEKYIVVVGTKVIACEGKEQAERLYESVPDICDSVFGSIFLYAPGQIEVDDLSFVNADYIQKRTERQLAADYMELIVNRNNRPISERRPNGVNKTGTWDFLFETK